MVEHPPPSHVRERGTRRGLSARGVAGRRVSRRSLRDLLNQRWPALRDLLNQRLDETQQLAETLGVLRIQRREERAAIKQVIPDAQIDLPTGGAAAASYLDITQLRDDAGYEPAYDTERAAADHIAWLRAGNAR